MGSFVVLHSEAMHILRASVLKCPWAQWSRAEVWAVPTAPPAPAAALAHSPPCLWQKIVQESSLLLCTPAPRKYHIIISDACWFVSWHEEFNFKHQIILLKRCLCGRDQITWTPYDLMQSIHHWTTTASEMRIKSSPMSSQECIKSKSLIKVVFTALLLDWAALDCELYLRSLIVMFVSQKQRPTLCMTQQQCVRDEHVSVLLRTSNKVPFCASIWCV